MLRYAISLFFWALSAPGLFFYGVLIVARLKDLFSSTPWHTSHTDFLMNISLLSGALGWTALLVMTVFWLMNRKLGWTIPVLGSLFALVGLLPFMLSLNLFVILSLPGIVFASYLVYWHVSHPDAAEGYSKNALTPPAK